MNNTVNVSGRWSNALFMLQWRVRRRVRWLGCSLFGHVESSEHWEIDMLNEPQQVELICMRCQYAIRRVPLSEHGRARMTLATLTLPELEQNK